MDAKAHGRLTEPIPLHRILREVLRHYTEFRTHFSRTGDHVINHGYFTYEDDGVTIKSREAVSISFLDLHRGIKDLSPRKREALFYNVILDKKQKEVAKLMGITTVSVGQYVEQAVLQLAEEYFAEELSQKQSEEDQKTTTNEGNSELLEQGRGRGPSGD